MLAMDRNAFDICLGVRFDEKKFYTYHNMPVALSELQTLFVECLYLYYLFVLGELFEMWLLQFLFNDPT